MADKADKAAEKAEAKRQDEEEARRREAEQAAREGRAVRDATPDQASDAQAAYEQNLQEADPKAEERARTEDPARWDIAEGLGDGGGQRASESGDPVVQRLVAEAQTARLNGNDERASAIDDRLRDAGYAVGDAVGDE